jgi:hypothetical protein
MTKLKGNRLESRRQMVLEQRRVYVELVTYVEDEQRHRHAGLLLDFGGGLEG